MVNTYCYCWQITRNDSTVFRYTTHSQELTFLGNSWKAFPTVDNTSIQKSLGLSVDNLEFVGAFNTDITFQDVSNDLWDNSRIIGYRVNHQDVTDYKLEYSGILSEFTYNDVGFRSEVRSTTFYYSRPRSDIYSRVCPFKLGDSSCGVNLSNFQVSATITALGNTSVTVSGVVLSDLYTLGSIIYSDGTEQLIRTQSSQVLNLWEPPKGTLNESVTVVQGCDKIRQTCKSTFSNIVNFGGFDLIPPEDINTEIGSPGRSVYNGTSYFDQLI